MQDEYVTTLSSLQQTTCTSPVTNHVQAHCDTIPEGCSISYVGYRSTANPAAREEPAKEIQAQVSNGCDPVSRFGRTAGLRRSQTKCCRPHARLSRQTVWVFPQKQGDIISIALPMCAQHSRFLCSEAGACMGFVV